MGCDMWSKWGKNNRSDERHTPDKDELVRHDEHVEVAVDRVEGGFHQCDPINRIVRVHEEDVPTTNERYGEISE